MNAVQSKSTPFACRYINTPAGTYLAVSASLRAVIGLVMLIIQLSDPSSTNSMLVAIFSQTMQTSVWISAVLNILTAAGIVLVRYKQKGDGLLNFVIVLSMFISWAVVVLYLFMYGFSLSGLNITFLIPILFFFAFGLYYYSCFSMFKVVRIELKQSEPAASSKKHLLPVFCIIIIAVSLLDIISTGINSENWNVIVTNVVNICVYCSLYMLARGFNHAHQASSNLEEKGENEPSQLP